MRETEGAFNPYGAILGGVGGGVIAGSGIGAVGAVWGFNGALGGGIMTGVTGYYGY